MKITTQIKLFILMSMIYLSQLQAQMYNTDLVAYYPFNNSLNDVSSYAAVASGSNITFVNDRNGKSLSSAYFNGSAKLEIIDAPQLKLFRNFTISFWFKPNNNTIQNLFSRTLYSTADNTYYGMAYGLGTDVSSFVPGVSLWVNDTKYCRYNSAWTRFTSGQNVNGWTFVTSVISNGTASLYLNGNLIKAEKLKIDSISNCGLSNFIFGANWSGDTRNFIGAIDEIKIFKKGLTIEEAKDLYINSDLVAYYPLNGDEEDKTAFSNHGVPSNLSFIVDNCSGHKVAYFNGTSSKLVIPDAIQIGLYDKFTLSMTVKPMASNKMNIYSKTLYNSADNTQHGIAYSTGSDLSQSGSEFRYFHNDTKDCRYNTQWTQLYTGIKTSNNWYTLTIVFDKGVGSFYVNGNLEKQTQLNNTSIINCGKSDYIIGANWVGDPRYFTGYMKDIKIYERALNTNEVADLSSNCPVVTSLQNEVQENTPFVFVNDIQEYAIANPNGLYLKADVYDMQGKLVKSLETSDRQKLLTLSKGMYQIVLIDGSKSWSFKVLK